MSKACSRVITVVIVISAAQKTFQSRYSVRKVVTSFFLANLTFLFSLSVFFFLYLFSFRPFWENEKRPLVMGEFTGIQSVTSEFVWTGNSIEKSTVFLQKKKHKKRTKVWKALSLCLCCVLTAFPSFSGGIQAITAMSRILKPFSRRKSPKTAPEARKSGKIKANTNRLGFTNFISIFMFLFSKENHWLFLIELHFHTDSS